jgi:sialidase-1
MKLSRLLTAALRTTICGTALMTACATPQNNQTATAAPLDTKQPFQETADLFLKGENGFATYRIPGIVVTAKGTVLVYCEARRDGNDWGTNNIYLRRSTDGGKTFDLARQIAHQGTRIPRNPVAIEKKIESELDQTVNNPVMIADKDGTVHFIYCVEYSHVFYSKSTDDGLTWSNPVDLTPVVAGLRSQYKWRVVASGPGHAIQLKNGRLLVPLWLSTSDGAKNGHGPSVVSTLYSDDKGASWKVGEIAGKPTPGDEWKSVGEPIAVELADGRVLMNLRSPTKRDRRLVTISPDGASGWSKPQFDAALREPSCMASLVRLSLPTNGGKSRILFSNPDTLKARAGQSGAPGTGRARENLTVKLSYDEGKTWPVSRVLDPGRAAYSDLAVLPSGTILCLYEKPGYLSLARFNLSWLSQGKDSLSLAQNDTKTVRK